MAVSTNYYFLIKRADKVLSFNATTHRLYEVCDYSALSSDTFTTKGVLYSVLTTNYNTILLAYTETETLSDGSIVYESEEITPEMGVISLADNDDGYLTATVAAFTPLSLLTPTDKVLAYTSSNVQVPNIESAVISGVSNIHNEYITVTVNPIFTYTRNVKYRYKIGTGSYSGWSTITYVPYEKFNIIIPSSELAIGNNTITVQLSSDDGLLLSETVVLTNAVTKYNNSPAILILNSESNDFHLKFALSDNDNVDKISYRLLLNNTSHTNLVIRDWTDFISQPLTVTHTIDYDNVVIDEVNTITIEYKDDFKPDTIFTAQYSFTGRYNNILFMNEAGEYYVNGKGEILKLLRFDSLYAGVTSDVRKITLKNGFASDVNNIRITSLFKETLPDFNIQLSKSNSPFSPHEELHNDNLTLKANEKLDFYMKIDSSSNSEVSIYFNLVAKVDSI